MRAFISSHRLGQHIGKMRNRCAPPPGPPTPHTPSQCLVPLSPPLLPSRFSVSPPFSLPVSQCLPFSLPVSQCLPLLPSRFSVSPPSPFTFLSVSPLSLHFSQCPPSPFTFLSVSPLSLHFSQCPPPPKTPRLCSRGSRTFHFTHIHCFPVPSSDTERRAAWTATETRSFTAGCMTLLRP